MRPFSQKGLFGGPNPAYGVTVDDPGAELARKRYLEGLRNDAPINWLSPHLKEDQSDFGPVYIALKALMSQAASAQVRAYKWHPEAKTEGDHSSKEYLPRGHPICRLLNRPNRRETGRQMRARAVQQRSLTGTWLGWRVDEGLAGTSAFDEPAEIWTVPTGTYTAVPVNPVYPNGAYRIMPFYPGPMALTPGTWQAGGVIVPADQMLVSQHPHPLVYKEGLSPLSACAPEIDTIQKIGRARNSIMSRAPVPSGWLELDSGAVFPDRPELNRIMVQLHNMMGGPDRAGRPAVFGPGQKWNPNQMQGIELPWTETWDQLMKFVLSVLGSTATMTGMSEAASYASLYAVLKQNKLCVLEPELDDLADTMNQQLIEPFWGEEYGVEFEPKSVGDEELLEKQIQSDLAAGLRTFDELRALRHLPLVGGAEGKKYVQVGGKGEGKPGEGVQGKPQMQGASDEEKRAYDPAGQGTLRNRSSEGSQPTRISPHVSLHSNGAGKHFAQSRK